MIFPESICKMNKFFGGIMIHLILCGGSGTRLWPLSRKLMPKQFVRLFDTGFSLFQTTVVRNAQLVEKRLIATGKEHFFLSLDQLDDIDKKDHSKFILEPMARNTAPAIALACLSLDPDVIVLVTPSDHLVNNQQEYERVVTQAKSLADTGYIVTFGIKPDYPETGFGYIQADKESVVSFTEKPDYDTARSYVESGRYFWNSGMFCFKAGVFLDELKVHAPSVLDACENVFSQISSSDHVIDIPIGLMETLPDISVDYAVMEKSEKVKMVACDIGWSDLGSFSSLYDEIKKPDQDNAFLLRGSVPVLPICADSKGNLVVSESRQIALLDVNDLVVVDTADALLISHKRSSQDIKTLVKQVSMVSPQLTEIHQLAHRPWGHYEVLLDQPQYKIKRITVKPRCKLSLQKHFHRNEHWIVVSGTATVTIGEREFLLRPNESTYIPMGEIHRLENEGHINLVMIEVQVGEYTGEDDIVRIDDVYGR